MKQEGAEASEVSYRKRKACPPSTTAAPLRPIERLVRQLVGEVFHVGFGRHYPFRHVVLL